MDSYRALRRVATVSRVLLLAASLAGIGLLIRWFESPAAVDAVDAALIKRHMEPHQERLHVAEAAEQNNEHAVSIFHLENARVALASALKGERLDPIKRQTFERLAQAYRSASREEEAIVILDEWIAFDPRDLRPVAWKASWQGVSGIDTLLDLHARFPHSAVLATLETPLAVALLEASREVDALVLAADTLAEPPDHRWQVYWAVVGAKIRKEDSRLVTPTIGDAGALSIDLSVPGDSHRLRIDGPAVPLLARDLSVRFEGHGPPVTRSLSDLTPRRQVRNVSQRTLEMVGGDPQIHIQVPTSLHGAKKLRVRITGWVMTAPHPRLTDFLASPGAGMTIAILDRRGDSQRVNRLRRARQWLDVLDPGRVETGATKGAG